MKILKKECISGVTSFDVRMSTGEIVTLISCINDLLDYLSNEQVNEKILCKNEEILQKYRDSLFELFNSKQSN
ncbi:hypothetical protein KKJ04_01820 [Xenorhabdus bovienii]|uniref:hypothetical protein n=1 Tax=Xenorhabdus bovienii TaxID=40576 RepID=UPI0023B34D39|nr:hypothetical protein [Xenorhabdus bovienii]MDE9444380.1 hypothetical protein [Xenorhabdus bovienii]